MATTHGDADKDLLLRLYSVGKMLYTTLYSQEQNNNSQPG